VKLRAQKHGIARLRANCGHLCELHGIGKALPLCTMASGGADKDKKNEVKCCSCQQVLSRDDQALAIKCSAGHYICAQDPKVADRCTTGFIQAQAETSYSPPIKCPVCPAPVVLPTFIRFLDDSQLSCHMIRVAMSTLQPGESLLECPNCRYSEISDCSTADVARLHCKYEGCGIVTCYVCKLKIGKLHWSGLEEGTVSAGEGEDESRFAERAEEHLTSCFPLATLKFKFDEVMEWNSKFKCPTCSFGGQKDDACTHMKECPCAVNWCYFCQQVLPPNMFDHNSDWHTRSAHCPLFLEELHDFDSTWPEDQAGCMEKLHRLVCLKKLKQLDLDVLNSQFRPITAVHRRTDSVGTTLLRSKPDPSRSADVFTVPSVAVRVGESVTVLRSNVAGEEGWSWVRTAGNNCGFLNNNYLSTVATRKPDALPTLDDLFEKFPASFPPGYSIPEIRGFDLHAPWYTSNGGAEGGESD
jgi:hypothetical protein